MMRAARFYNKEDIRIEEVPMPKCGANQVKVKPAFVGICGTDVHEYLAGPIFIPTSPHALTGEKLPITMGHEFSATVVEVGSEVTGLTHGQHAVILPSIYDGTCAACTSVPSLPNVCDDCGFVGLSGWGGGLSDACVLPATHIIPIPSSIPLHIGALVEPLSVGWHAVSRSPLSTKSPSPPKILILGGGPIGIAVVYSIKAQFPDSIIIVSEISKRRQEFAKSIGVDFVLDPSDKSVNVPAEVKRITEGTGVDVVFDCAGVQSGLRDACKSIRARGTVVNVAIWEKEILFQPNDLVFKEGNYVACLGYVREDFDNVIQAISSGAMKPDKMITKTIALENLVKDGFQELVQNKDKHVKIVIEI